jgi:glycosyltransferase involved in cell wall biosynthesis
LVLADSPPCLLRLAAPKRGKVLMSLLSLIVPVYRVEKYLAVCLDSILEQSFADFEVIAVNDASDDGSADILARYADKDSRIKIVNLDRNRGLGAARNAGIAHASGTYVWCVDSDDWLPDGTLAAIAAKLAQADPDLLVTGYARVYPDGHTEHYPVTAIGAMQTLPDVFTFEKQPGLLNILWIACNKIIRRECLVESGLTFGPGWYEDVAFVLPIMLLARRISLLDRYCYAYRQRPNGAITQTVSDKHFDVFDQWQRVFEFMDSRPGRFTELRTLIFQRMIWHFLQVLGHSSRVPRSMRRDYFRRMTMQYRRYLPVGGCPVPPGNDGIKQRLVAAGAWRTFEVLMAVWQVRGRLVRLARPRPSPPPPPTEGRSPVGTG